MTGCLLGGGTANSDGDCGWMGERAAEPTGLDPMTIEALPTLGMLLDNGATLQIPELDEPWEEAEAEAIRTRIRPCLLNHIKTGSHR